MINKWGRLLFIRSYLIPNRDNIDDIKIINLLDIRLGDADLLPLRITL